MQFTDLENLHHPYDVSLAPPNCTLEPPPEPTPDVLLLVFAKEVLYVAMDIYFLFSHLLGDVRLLRWPTCIHKQLNHFRHAICKGIILSGLHQYRQ